MNANYPRITARVDLDTQELLKKASAIMGISSINAFVVSSAIEKAKKIIANEEALELSKKDALLLMDALDTEPIFNARLNQAFQNYKAKRD